VDHIICDLLGACVASTREGEEEKMEKEKWNGMRKAKV
jgi:hypothetical protein